MLRKTTLPFIFCLVLFFLVFTLTTYSYWDNLQNNSPDHYINMGAGVELVIKNVTAEPPLGKSLIPKTCLQGVNDVYEIELNYEVNLSRRVLDDLELEVSVTNITIDNDNAYAALVTIDIFTAAGYINEDIVGVTIKVGLKCPESEEIYRLIAGKTIIFDVRFAALQA